MNTTIHNNLARVNVLQYGAVPDGTTDCLPAIQQAIQVALARPHAHHQIYFPPGRYAVSDTIEIADEDRISIRGASRELATITWTSDSVNNRLMAFREMEGLEVIDLGFDGRSLNATSLNDAIALRGVERATIRDCLFMNTGNLAISLSKDGDAVSGDPLPNGSVANENVQITNNHFERLSGQGAISSNRGGVIDLDISDNTFKNLPNFGIEIVSGNAGQTTAVTIHNNKIRGLLASRGNTDFVNGIIVGRNSTQITISDNIITDLVGETAASGINIQTEGGGSSPEGLNAFGLNISDNQIVTVIRNDGGRSNGIAMTASERGNVAFTNINDNVVRNVDVGLRINLGPVINFSANNPDPNQSSNPVINVVGNTFGTNELGIWTNGVRDSADPSVTRPQGLMNIASNNFYPHSNGAAWSGLVIWLQMGNVHGNTFWGRNYGSITCITLLDDLNLPANAIRVRRFVNNNAFFEFNNDITIQGGEYIAVHQLGQGYEWLQDEANGGVKHRNSNAIPASVVAGQVTGTET